VSITRIDPRNEKKIGLCVGWWRRRRRVVEPIVVLKKLVDQ